MAGALKIRAGMSIVEICIGLLIISVAAIMMMSFSRNTFLMSRDAKGKDAAYLAAQKKMSELAAQAFPANGGPDWDTVDNIICTRNWVIKDTTYIKRAIVTVTYPSLKGGSQNITFSGAIH